MPIKNPARAHRSLGSAALAVVLFAGLTACAPAQDAAAPSITPDNGAPAATATPAEPEFIRGTLVKVLTGDTVVISPVGEDGKPNGKPNITVRALGISAPKLNECGGPEAAAELDRIVLTQGFFSVTFEPDIKHTNTEGQTVGHLTSGTNASGEGGYNPAPTMISGGFASAWHEGDTAPKGFAELEKNTAMQKARKTGLWETCGTVGLGSSIPAATLPSGPNS